MVKPIPADKSEFGGAILVGANCVRPLHYPQAQEERRANAVRPYEIASDFMPPNSNLTVGIAPQKISQERELSRRGIRQKRIHVSF